MTASSCPPPAVPSKRCSSRHRATLTSAPPSGSARSYMRSTPYTPPSTIVSLFSTAVSAPAAPASAADEAGVASASSRPSRMVTRACRVSPSRMPYLASRRLFLVSSFPAQNSRSFTCTPSPLPSTPLTNSRTSRTVPLSPSLHSTSPPVDISTRSRILAPAAPDSAPASSSSSSASPSPPSPPSSSSSSSASLVRPCTL
mmetsp:Transcript_64039/g.150678  ORF Transcript_64039/g.150678 Transcript_64039/m.150678 type:complete len:200 (+) Transcript_64039:632-1231(+)